jgi:alanine-glyoxylate transaminase/(R)-3-amino-2-methylpropionate-pyruvate transaminase
MQGLTARRVLSGRSSLIAQRWLSQVAQKENPVQENGVSIPKMPPFDYSPPPYNGPSAGEILAKRKAYLSPSLLQLHSKAVSPRHT